jgi:phage shock protein PspC (stress-responsive transcriptional regulator)
MKKVINITLGGIVFAIEQSAYDALALYLEDIKTNISSSDDAQEIVGDIETAIAEKFLLRKRSEKISVTSEDVAEVIGEMGSPADFGEDGFDASEKSTKRNDDAPIKKRLYRDADDVIVAGVASGLAKYFDIDPVIVRLIFVISVFFNGIGLLAYVVLWLVVPKALTTAQKYAMRGEKVTLKEITEQVKKNIRSLDSTEAVGLWNRLRSVLATVFEIIGGIVVLCMHILRFLVGLILLFIGAVSLAGLVSMYSIVLLSDKILLPTQVQTVLDAMIGSPLGLVAVASSFVAMAIPFLVCILTGGSLLAKRTLFSVSKVITLAVVWIIAVALAITSSALQAEKVMQEMGVDTVEERTYQININRDDSNESIIIEMQPSAEETGEATPPPSNPQSLPNTEPVVCTMDAKMCPDGSFVGRSGPNCEFVCP